MPHGQLHSIALHCMCFKLWLETRVRNDHLHFIGSTSSRTQSRRGGGGGAIKLDLAVITTTPDGRITSIIRTLRRTVSNYSHSTRQSHIHRASHCLPPDPGGPPPPPPPRPSQESGAASAEGWNGAVWRLRLAARTSDVIKISRGRRTVALGVSGGRQRAVKSRRRWLFMPTVEQFYGWRIEGPIAWNIAIWMIGAEIVEINFNLIRVLHWAWQIHFYVLKRKCKLKH